jgi:hypothetical protein
MPDHGQAARAVTFLAAAKRWCCRKSGATASGRRGRCASSATTATSSRSGSRAAPGGRRPIDVPGGEWDGDRGPRLAECAATGRWFHRELEWQVDTLQLLRAGDWHSLWASWLPGFEPWGWYVNLQEPFRRSELGFRDDGPRIGRDRRGRPQLALEGRGRARDLRRERRLRPRAAAAPARRRAPRREEGRAERAALQRALARLASGPGLEAPRAGRAAGIASGGSVPAWR